MPQQYSVPLFYFVDLLMDPKRQRSCWYSFHRHAYLHTHPDVNKKYDICGGYPEECDFIQVPGGSAGIVPSGKGKVFSYIHSVSPRS